MLFGGMYVTIGDAAESFHVHQIIPISNHAVSNQLLSPHLCLAMQFFGLRLAKRSLAPCLKFWAKLMLFGGMNVTICAAAEPFHVHQIIQISVNSVYVQPAPESPSVPGHAIFWAEIGKKFGTPCIKFCAKLMLFGDMYGPYVMLLNHSMSTILDKAVGDPTVDGLVKAALFDAVTCWE
jgi:hypothetical protein